MNIQQSGSVLIIALAILLMVTLMGVSALGSGIFHEKMAFNAQTKELTFHGAETAINGVIAAARVDGAMLTDMIDKGAVSTDHCVTMSSGLEDDACTDDQTVDIRTAFQSESSSHFDAKKPLLNSDAGSFMDFQFATEGRGRFKLNPNAFSSINYQEWRKIGPSSAQFSDDTGALDYGYVGQGD